MPKKRPSLSSVALTALRRARGWTEHDLSEKTGISRRVISLYESEREPPRDRLLSMASAMGYGEEAVDGILLGLKQATGLLDQPTSPIDPRPAEQLSIHQAAWRVGLFATEAVAACLAGLERNRLAGEAREEAGRLWQRLAQCTPTERRLLVEKANEFQTWALAERLCHESEAAAADDAENAVDLADLAVRVAKISPGDPAWSSRLLGYCLAFQANALRVRGDLKTSEELLARTWACWREGEGADHGLLPEWRLLDLEASLHRDSRRFQRALDCLDRAFAAAPQSSSARILLKQASTLEQMGHGDRALDALHRASRLISPTSEPRLSCVLYFNLATCLCQLGRYAEAVLLLPEMKELSSGPGRALDRVRIVWLEGKIAAGLGNDRGALAALVQARKMFLSLRIAYDYALVTLELTTVLLRTGSGRQVRNLAAETLWIFDVQGVPAEALRALTIFRSAVEKDRVSLGLARRLLSFLERARRRPADQLVS